MAGITGKGGQKGRSGRKPKFDEEELDRLLNKCWPKKQREEAIKNAASRAARGDLEALKLLMAYSFGKPKEKHEITGDFNPAVYVILNSDVSPAKEADDSVSEQSD
ncbi:MAG TPA: hypothetical protein VF762_10865 [Blastocatellia bacterium]|jgi:hypothetical protein